MANDKEPGDVAESERGHFEAWADAAGFNIHRDESEKYTDYHRTTTRWAWEAWQARAFLAATPTPAIPAVPIARLVQQQAEDEGLWFDAQHASEAYLQQALRELHAAVESQPAIPPGFKVVPVEPTERMQDAACDQLGLCAADKADDEIRQEYRVAYRAMLSAAPVPEAGQGVSDDSVAVVMAIVEHIEGWKSATYGWQDDPVLEIAARNREAATQAHAAECLRRISAALLSPAPAQPVEVNRETSAQREEVCAAWADLPDALRCHPGLKRLYSALGGPEMERGSPPPQSAQLIEPKAQTQEQIDAAILNGFALHGVIKNPDALVKAGRALLEAAGVTLNPSGVSEAGPGLMEGKDAVRYRLLKKLSLHVLQELVMLDWQEWDDFIDAHDLAAAPPEQGAK